MSEYTISKNISSYIFSFGALAGLEELVDRQRSNSPGNVIFLVDHYFQSVAAPKLDLPEVKGDLLLFVDTTEEPSVEQVDSLAKELRSEAEGITGIVAVGGGSTLDVGKAVANLLTNPGPAADYQGWDLVKKAGKFKIGVPTVSGTGAEASRTCVLMNYELNLKLGMNSDFTIYDQLVLDPELTKTVPRDQYFYSGMDTYIHCIESLQGSYRNAIGDAYSQQALVLIRDVFLGEEDMQSPINREKLMLASYLGGSAIAKSYVGVVHPLSAALSVCFGMHHCLANCVVLQALDEFYPTEAEELRKMAAHNSVEIKKGLLGDIDQNVLQRLSDSSIIHEKPLRNALGDDFKSILNQNKLAELYSAM